jgi:hypothetical protein
VLQDKLIVPTAMGAPGAPVIVPAPPGGEAGTQAAALQPEDGR